MFSRGPGNVSVDLSLLSLEKNQKSLDSNVQYFTSHKARKGSLCLQMIEAKKRPGAGLKLSSSLVINYSVLLRIPFQGFPLDLLMWLTDKDVSFNSLHKKG